MQIFLILATVGLTSAGTLYFRPHKVNTKDIICPDQKSQCPTGTTCCKSASGVYGCCPIPNAVCCSDMKHCCPEDTTCDTSSGTCHRENNVVIDWFKKVPSLTTAVREPTITCPDGQSQCKLLQTCCKLASGGYGCCPIPKAVCCSDMKHCCPEDTTCDTSSGTCHRENNVVIDWFKKVPSLTTAVREPTITCPDGQSQCKTSQTCCKLANGNYGCCPLPKAVCCADMKHCCAENTTCDTKSGKCIRKETVEIKMYSITDHHHKPPPHSVMCPDGESECMDGQTCCLLPDQTYGCCPIEDAVCCADHVHCCPQGTTCDLSAKKCVGSSKQFGLASLELFRVQQAKMVKIVGNIVCPDGQSECKSGQTCCKNSQTGYGCCPLPKAVCCSDMRHCCPESTKCEPSSSKCIRGDVSMDWFEKVPSLTTAVTETPITCPDGQSQCKSLQTCCKLASGGYGCCPIPKAVCCSDMRHCCPESTKCEPSSSKCIRGDVSMDWYEKVPSLTTAITETTITCPDGQSQCKSLQTCCKLASGGYGCCPIPKAVCCSDMRHCCPESTKCEPSSAKCIRGDVSMDWFEKVPSLTTAITETTITCPDGQSQCKSLQTCCKLASGGYGCCPIPKAVCCSDMRHCCPESTKCEPSSSKCIRGDVSMDWYEKVPSLTTAITETTITCPDGQSQCKSLQTCCKLASGGYGCCPIPKAVCCSDMKHCCPESTKCEPSSAKCIRGDVSMDWFEKVPSLTTAVTEATITCPDGRSQCKSLQTCCKLASGGYGCCPIPKAVCCSDMKHCCPESTKCEPSSAKCIRGDVSMDWFEKIPSLTTAVTEATITCPDGRSQCKSLQTCCKLASGGYGCCPIPKAVCCSDMKHCCPESTKCEPSSAKCIRGDVSMDWFEKVPSLTTAVTEATITCPDGRSQCKSLQTCCKLASGGYGCCPIPKAVCCSDMKHCCPESTKCEPSSAKCIRGDVSMDWFEKVPSLTTAVTETTITCPDGQSQCKSLQTCCKLASGGYGCCPIPKAVCCSDMRHCCPESTKCEPSSSKCIRGDVSMDWYEKVPSLTTAVTETTITCPDGQSQCKSLQTCCKLASGGYGCCPIPKAVCCSDMRHCCPENTKCEPSSAKCIRGDVIMDWFEKVPSLTTAVTETTITCPDGQSQCKSSQTCCKLASGGYGCCPIPKAVCCSDMRHCCPENTKCEPSSAKCIRGDVSMDWFEKVPSLTTAVTETTITCPDGQSQCKSSQTCCKLASGGYGCCPIPKAVCCSDMRHCCPESTKCEPSSSKCIRGDVSMDWFEKVSALKSAAEKPAIEVSDVLTQKTVEGLVTCEDKITTCPQDNICCKYGDKYGCCAYSKGVCCKNGNFCCPHGYICDEGPYICRMPDAKKIFKDTANLFLQRILKEKRLH